ncbi:MAG: right-handed parallel beta-helix repeat-containing protein [Verrucomicrobia bacterium]|nr:right-handed parallel beta-helix repeat-containing protein [Verrucomicrobiota bacterium]
MWPVSRSLGVAGLVAIVPFTLWSADLTFYVAPNGNDAWSGRRPNPTAGHDDGPFATPAAALAAARTARAGHNGSPASVEILLRDGTYELTEPLRLTPEDSGSDRDHPLVIGAYRHEKPILSGGQRLTGWQPALDRPGLWKANVPAQASHPWLFRQLFVNGQRRQRARTPNTGFFRIQGASPQDHPAKIHFAPGDIKPEWAERGDVELIALLAWADLRMPIRAVDDLNHVATLAGDARPSNRESDARYYIENAPDALDSPGEWYLDRRTATVLYWPMPGENPAKSEVVAPRLPDLVVIQGDFNARKAVRHVVWRGLTFAYTDWRLGEDGYADTQAAIATPGDFRADGAVDCVVEDCTFTHLGNYALEFNRGCRRIRIDHNELVDLGGGGIRIGETEVRQDPFDLTDHNEIADNEIHHLGRVFAPAVGVLILQSGQNQVVHNDIHDLFYTAISVGWTWGYRETPCRDNLIGFNRLYDIGQGMLSDMGAVYTLGIQRGTVVRNNLVHDVNSFTYGGWGLYTDEGSSDILLENNVVYRTKSAGFHQHYGRENILRNNIFAFGKEHQLMRTRAEPHLSFTFERNIVYFDSGDLLGSNWSGDNFKMDDNLYFDTRPGASTATLRLAGNTWEQWHQRGQDVHSLVADPRFVNPAKYDFRLRRHSPAFQLGFHPIDLSQVGVRHHS